MLPMRFMRRLVASLLMALLRRADIIIVYRPKDKGVILDPTIRFEMMSNSHKRADNYIKVVETMLSAYLKMGYNMSLKILFLHSHLDIFLPNLGAVSGEHEERFHREISKTKRRYTGKSSSSMPADYRRFLVKDSPGSSSLLTEYIQKILFKGSKAVKQYYERGSAGAVDRVPACLSCAFRTGGTRSSNGLYLARVLTPILDHSPQLQSARTARFVCSSIRNGKYSSAFHQERSIESRDNQRSLVTSMTSLCSEIGTKLLEGWMAIMVAVKVDLCAVLARFCQISILSSRSK
ncbi:hypothetical protein ANN_19436 [Periplaneta americana]|uniref:Uncharacterized protein n=1 Tax=Periplaneta americana TaxID=6978 RepID=A0ABQ8SAS8_PERAM|nr:hypothetical protein ANN_19436 [Periplaneta americana]